MTVTQSDHETMLSKFAESVETAISDLRSKGISPVFCDGPDLAIVQDQFVAWIRQMTSVGNNGQIDELARAAIERYKNLVSRKSNKTDNGEWDIASWAAAAKALHESDYAS